MKDIDIQICTGKKCDAMGSTYILSRIQNDAKMYNDYENVNISTCSCQGKCKEASVIVLDGKKFTRQNPATASKLLRERVNNIKEGRK